MRINQSSAFTTIKLGEAKDVPNKVQYLRTGKFSHPKYGQFEITTQTLSEMKSNFDNRVRGIDISFDYYHEAEAGDASAWVQSLELSGDGQELWAVVEWTPKASQKLAERELRYFSPDFMFKWDDPEKGVSYKNVIFGGGLTNRPFVKEMKAIVADEKQGEQVNELEKAQLKIKEQEAQIVKLSEEKVAAEKQMADMKAAAPAPNKVQELEAAIAKLQSELAAEKQKGEAALAEKVKSDEAAKLSAKKAEFTVLLSDGKACAAQEKAFMEGNMAEFIKLAEKPNLNPGGSSETPNVTLAEDDAKSVIKLAEQKRKEDSKLSVSESIKLAKKELKK